MPVITTSISLPPELYKQLMERVGKNGLTRNAIMVRALQQYFQLPLYEPHIPQMSQMETKPAGRITDCTYKDSEGLCIQETISRHGTYKIKCEPRPYGKRCRFYKRFEVKKSEVEENVL